MKNEIFYKKSKRAFMLSSQYFTVHWFIQQFLRLWPKLWKNSIIHYLHVYQANLLHIHLLWNLLQKLGSSIVKFNSKWAYFQCPSSKCWNITSCSSKPMPLVHLWPGMFSSMPVYLQHLIAYSYLRIPPNWSPC